METNLFFSSREGKETNLQSMRSLCVEKPNNSFFFNMADPNLPNKALVSLHVFVPSFYSISELKTWTIYDRIPTNLSFQISAIFFLFGLHLYLANVISFFLINLNFLTTKIPRDSLLFRGKQVFFFLAVKTFHENRCLSKILALFWLVNRSRFALAPCLILLQKY